MLASSVRGFAIALGCLLCCSAFAQNGFGPPASRKADPATGDSRARALQQARTAGDREDETSDTTLDQAAAAGWVEILSIKGRGLYCGAALRMEVKRVKKARLHLVVSPGTVFVSHSRAVQNMLGFAFVEEVVLDDDAVHTFDIEAYCLDFGRKTPTSKDTFDIGSVDRVYQAFLRKADEHLRTHQSVQGALWIFRDPSESRIRDVAENMSRRDVAEAVELLAAISERREPRIPLPIADPFERVFGEREPNRGNGRFADGANRTDAGQTPQPRGGPVAAPNRQGAGQNPLAPAQNGQGANPFAQILERFKDAPRNRPVPSRAAEQPDNAPARDTGGVRGFGGPVRGFDGKPVR